MTERQIKYALDKLIENGLIITANYNDDKYDRTLWYAVTELGKSILQNCPMHWTKLSNGADKIVQPIPYINTDNKPIKEEVVKKKAVFKPPSLDEVNKYIEDKKLNVDGTKFFTYFSEGNWVDSKGEKVKNWKQKLLTWDNHSKKEVSYKPKQNSFLNATERKTDYDRLFGGGY